MVLVMIKNLLSGFLRRQEERLKRYLMRLLLKAVLLTVLLIAIVLLWNSIH